MSTRILRSSNIRLGTILATTEKLEQYYRKGRQIIYIVY